MQYSNDQMILALATGIGAYGGFPTAPAIFNRLAKHEIVQWTLVFVLLYQGGAGQDIKFAAMATVAMYVVHMVLNKMEEQ
jgi:hypothetical protein